MTKQNQSSPIRYDKLSNGVKVKYTPPTLTVDMVVFQVNNDKLEVLLTKRANEPFKNAWALPGGYVAADHTLLEAAKKIMLHKVGISIDSQLSHIEQLQAFDSIARDPRGHAVAITYSGYGRDIIPNSPAQITQFFDVNKLPKLAFDHIDIIKYALHRLRTRLGYTNLASAFMPYEFTLTELQNTYEAILSKTLDKRNFRKRITNLDMLHDTGKTTKGGAHRPARLYRFCYKEIAVVKSNRF